MLLQISCSFGQVRKSLSIDFSNTNINKDKKSIIIKSNQRDWTDYLFVDVAICNKENKKIAIQGRLNNLYWHDAAMVVNGNDIDTLRIYLKNYKTEPGTNEFPVKGMWGLPNGYVQHWEPLDIKHVDRITLKTLGSEEHKYQILSVSVQGSLKENTLRLMGKDFFPFVDRFGQYKHLEWNDKIKGQSDFALAQVKEEKFNSKLRQQDTSEIDQYGGFLCENKFNATGHFYPLKYQNKWWLVTPDGNLFWSVGVNCINYSNNTTNVRGRNNYFSDLDNNFLESNGNYNFTKSNLKYKYGAEFITDADRKLQERLKVWGVNTFGNWSDIDLARSLKKPYVVAIHYSFEDRLANGQLPNVFNPDFEKIVQKAIKYYERCFEDPYCIGFFIDNELHGWNQLENNENRAALKKYAEKYFKTCHSTLRLLAPNKLYLGSRLDFHDYPDAPEYQNLIVEIASKYCDVLSFNRYNYTVSDFRLPNTIDKPVLIGEFHFGTQDRGIFGGGLKTVKNQQQRSRMYEFYMSTALNNKFVIGAHWFQWQDQSLTGRVDGENFQVGIIDVTDTPYQEMIQSINKVTYQLIKELRLEK